MNKFMAVLMMWVIMIIRNNTWNSISWNWIQWRIQCRSSCFGRKHRQNTNKLCRTFWLAVIPPNLDQKASKQVLLSKNLVKYSKVYCVLNFFVSGSRGWGGGGGWGESEKYLFLFLKTEKFWLKIAREQKSSNLKNGQLFNVYSFWYFGI